MPNVLESMNIMDGPNITFGKHRIISISRALALALTLLVVVCIVATGLIVYFATSCSRDLREDQYVSDNHCDPPSSNGNTMLPEITNILTEISTELPVTTSINRIEVEEVKTDVSENLRLPSSVVPISYEISLIPFLEEGNFTFHGNITILVNITEETDKITLHSDSLEIDMVDVWTNDDQQQIKDVTNDTKKHFLIIRMMEMLVVGEQYYVNLVFRGELNDLMLGFYRSSYKDGDSTRYIAVTQFQVTDARRAFPCFDEPALKAKFQINLARPKNMNTLSNMRKIETTDHVDGLEDYVWDHYEESVPMSTYLLALVVCDFESISSGTFSVWARKSAINQSRYSLEIGPKLLKFYEAFFGIEYPLPKMDMIAVPDFSAGAMENWGLITFRESLLLYQEGTSSSDSLQNIAEVVAHELAHQWFGNLVTPVWWTDLWLNEGFATFAEYLGANSIDPSWKMLDQFIIGEVQTSMFLDALKTSHQISVEVNDPDEISNIFDRISYSKSASIIRMMQHFLTDEVFGKGLTKYLSERTYGNAEQDDLWRTLTIQSHEDGVLDPSLSVKEIMDTWTLQTGFPILTVTRNYKDSSVLLEQERFTLDNSGKDDTQLWWIPVTIGFPNGTHSPTWMAQERSKSLTLGKLSEDDWLLVNLNFTGYYRVNYDEKNWQLLAQQLTSPRAHLKLDPKNRAQILDDAFSIASAGYLDYAIALNISTYLQQEREFVPWKAALNHLDYLDDMFERSPHFDKYKAYLLQLMGSFYEELGFTESSQDSLLMIYSRIEILQRVCRLGLRDCIVKSVHEFQNWRNSVDPDKYNSISPNLRQIIYCTAIRVGGQEEWDFLWERYQNTNVGNEKEILMDALACSREVWILSRYLDWAITENSGIRKQDIARVFVSVAHNAIGKDITYKFMKVNWERIRSYLGPSSMALGSIVRACATFNNEEDISDFKSFVNSRKDNFGIAMKAAQQTIEQAEANSRWMKKNLDTVLEWLTNVGI